jgi:hypothetical protein
MSPKASLDIFGDKENLFPLPEIEPGFVHPVA